MGRLFLITAAISAFLAVGIGAFGAHGLKDTVPADLMAVYRTAVDYHFYHSLGLLIVGSLLLHKPELTRLHWTGYFFIAGIVIFSGSLYILAITGIRWWGAVTPIGGLMFMAGWATMAVTMYSDIDKL